MLPNLKIGDLVEIPSVQTVIRLESGVEAARIAADTFVFTSDVFTHFQILAQALERATGQGYFLLGDFGSGKSHFLAALAAWLGGYDTENAQDAQHPGLQKLFSSEKRYLPVTISLVKYRGNTPLERIITESIEESLRMRGIDAVISERSYFIEFLKGILNDQEISKEFSLRTGVPSEGISKWIDEHRPEAFATGLMLVKSKGLGIPELPVHDRYEIFENALNRVLTEGYSGIVLLIDELSEFFRSKPDSPSLNEDARTLQLIGEISKSSPLWIIAAVQESIERTGDIAQATFRKIKDRFPVKLHLSTLHIRDLISKRLVKKKPGAESHIDSIYKEYCRYFPAFNFTNEYFKNVYPVHPLTLSLLEGLGDLFSQHRGIVDFVHTRLAGDPSGTVAGILHKPCTELLAPDAIYEHFSPRIAEFSSFFIYPSQIIPHLDSVIDNCHSDESDRILSRRLVRILVLYAIHPTAAPPTVRVLAELASCMISFHDSDAGAQYISEVILDPVVEKSRFLNKNSALNGNSLDATYVISTSDDQNKILKARVDRTIKELAPDDTRIFTLPLAEIPENFSWPGAALWSGYVDRTIVWRQSTRRTVIFYLQSGNESSIEGQINDLLETGKADFAFVIATEKIVLNCNYTAIWVISKKSADDAVLREYFSFRMVLGELRPTNPADGPLIPLLKEQIRKLEPAARQAVLHQIYEGSFTDLTLEPDSPVRQLKRFDRLLEIAGEQILESRFPRYKEIASRGLPPSLRYYQRIFDEFVIKGTVSMRDARSQGFSELIETLAVPLGLVEVKSGNYLLAPNTISNQFLSGFFAQLPASGQIHVSSLLLKLQTGPFGVPRDCANFILASLAYCGHISLINRGRSLPLEFIKISTVDQIDAVAPGEIISDVDRKTITESCSFLTGSSPVDNFGLKMQRDSWQAALKFKTSAATIINDLGRQIQTLRGYEAFSYLDIENIAQKCSSLMGVIDEIKVSYSAREGLERFLISWRASGLTTDDITGLKQMHRFLSRHVERIVFVNHYLNHRSVTEAASLEKSVAEKREAALFMLRNIESMILPDDGENFQNTFEIFREAFVQTYSGYHTGYQKLKVKPVLSKHSNRALLTIKRLSSIQSLDCPRGTRQYIDMCDKPQAPACMRNLSEELMRSPLCSCGFICSDEPPVQKDSSPEYEIERILKEYYQILSDQKIREAISARSFALRDIDNKAHGNLDKLHQFLKKDEFSGTIALRDILDESTTAELNRALSGQARIENRSIRSLQNELSGRRLTPSHIRDVVEKWIGSAADDTVLSLSEPDDQSAYNTADPLLWPFIHKDLFIDSVNERKVASLQINILATELEQNFPSEKLIRTFLQWSDNSLIDFICNEPAHLGAVKGAWSVFANRVLGDSRMTFDREVFSKYLDDTEALRIKQRMVALRDFTSTLHLPFPQKLKVRIPAAAIYKDAWATTRLKSDIIAKIENISSDAQAWFDTLPPVPEVISPGELLPDVACTILLIDAIPPDVWIAMLEIAPDVFSAGAVKWFRQTSQSLTIESINALFGFAANKDPMEELALRGIDYCTISGDEDRKWLDIIPQPEKDSSQLIRINLFDRQAHSGTIYLQDMAPTLANILGKNLPSFVSFCKENKRTLLVTTDHGLSFSQKGLHHGTGGIFEKTIFCFEM